MLKAKYDAIENRRRGNRGALIFAIVVIIAFLLAFGVLFTVQTASNIRQTIDWCLMHDCSTPTP